MHILLKLNDNFSSCTFKHKHGVQRRMISVDNFFVFLRLLIFALLLLCDLVHDVETIFHLSYVLTVSENLF